MYSEPTQKSRIKSLYSFQKLAQISGNCIKFPKKRIKKSVAIEMFKTENHYNTPQVVDATDGTRHTRKRGLRTLKRTLSLRTLTRTLSLRTLKRTLERTLLLSTLKRILSLSALKVALSLRTLKRTLSVSTLKRTLSLRTLKGPNQTLTPPCRL